MMNKEEITKPRYCIQWNAHERYMCTVLCSLMEHQSLVDLAICCGNNTIHAHRCILAANSPYFREQLEKNTNAEQVIISGLDFVIIKSIIEFIYCGETNVSEENMKYMIAAAKIFQIRGLQALVAEGDLPNNNIDQIHIPPPIFISKKPKYPTALRSFNNFSSSPPGIKTFIPNDQFLQRKMKRKYIRSEAERACAKEAAASRLALEALQKELANTPQVNSFVIEESCTETTVENFIPHTEETFIENLNDISGMQVVNYGDINYSTNGNMNMDKSFLPNSLLQYNLHNRRDNVEQDVAANKIKHILGGEIPSNVEIMFRTSDGNFVNVTDEVLQNITKGALQYQVIDENGQVGEIQELQVLDKAVLETPPESVNENYLRNTVSSSGNANAGSEYVSEDSKSLLDALTDTSGVANLEVSDNKQSLHTNSEGSMKLEQKTPNIESNPYVSETGLLDLSVKEHDTLSIAQAEPLPNELSPINLVKCEQNVNKACDNSSVNNPNQNIIPDYESEDPCNIDANELSDASSTLMSNWTQSEDVTQPKKMKMNFEENNTPDNISDVIIFSPRKTRSAFRIGSEDFTNYDSKSLSGEESVDFKKDKSKRVMATRKRK